MTFNRFIAVIFVISLSPLTLADGNSIGKIYHPYVQLLEKEIEYAMLYQRDNDMAIESGLRHQLGYGQAFSDTFFVEAYIIAEENNHNCPWGGGVHSEETLKSNRVNNQTEINKLIDATCVSRLGAWS